MSLSPRQGPVGGSDAQKNYQSDQRRFLRLTRVHGGDDDDGVKKEDIIALDDGALPAVELQRRCGLDR